MLRVLVIDDDRELCQLVSVCLVREGMNVQIAHDGRSGLSLAISGQYDLAILDVMLPKLTGLQVLKQLRSTSNIGILMLTARGDEADRIMGLEYKRMIIFPSRSAQANSRPGFEPSDAD